MNPPLSKAERQFRLSAWVTLAVIYLVILAGGIVRATGSGMGCPDWPQCFGRIIPPTDVSQLPPDYQTRYHVQGKPIEAFNAAKTWTEYVNRLVGVLSGIACFVMVIFALRIWKERKSALLWSFITFILLAIQGYLGAKVVSTNLDVNMITWHMLLALLIVFTVIINIGWKTAPKGSHQFITKRGLKFLPTLSLLTLLLMLGQIVIGTEVRETIDRVALSHDYQDRGSWIAETGMVFVIHRSFSILLTLVNIITIIFIYRETRQMGSLYLSCSVIYFLIGIEVSAGIIMAYLDFPAFAQPIHLWLATIWAGVNFFVFLVLFKQFYELKWAKVSSPTEQRTVLS